MSALLSNNKFNLFRGTKVSACVERMPDFQTLTFLTHHLLSTAAPGKMSKEPIKATQSILQSCTPTQAEHDWGTEKTELLLLLEKNVNLKIYITCLC